jgi:RecA/RadA recombinase
MVIGDCECGKTRNLNVVWLDIEGKWNTEWAQGHGVMVERVFLSKPLVAEEAIDIVDAFFMTGVADIVVLDSIEHLIPLKEAEASAEADVIGLRARKLNQGLRKWLYAGRKKFRESLEKKEFRVPSLWMVNQVRHKIGVVFGNPETTPGGKGVGFATAVEVRTSGGSASKYETDEKLMETYAVELGFRVAKNQVAAAQIKGNYKICLKGDDVFHKGQILDHEYVLFHALTHGVVEQISKVKYGFNGQEFHGKAKLVDHWARNPEVYELVKTETLRKSLE